MKKLVGLIHTVRTPGYNDHFTLVKWDTAKGSVATTSGYGPIGAMDCLKRAESEFGEFDVKSSPLGVEIFTNDSAEVLYGPYTSLAERAQSVMDVIAAAAAGESSDADILNEITSLYVEFVRLTQEPKNDEEK